VAAFGLLQGETIVPPLKGLIQEYCEYMDWERETRKPTKETLEKLDLTETVEGL
jgi:aldehyde:ferredoxin oxidoreductase